MSRPDLESAFAPVFADLERDHPGLLRLEWSHFGVWLWDSTRSGTGIRADIAEFGGPDSVVDVADKVQEAAVEALWGEGKGASWPLCPEHPGAHPLAPCVESEQAVWVCPISHQVGGVIGQLPPS